MTEHTEAQLVEKVCKATGNGCATDAKAAIATVLRDMCDNAKSPIDPDGEMTMVENDLWVNTIELYAKQHGIEL